MSEEKSVTGLTVLDLNEHSSIVVRSGNNHPVISYANVCPEQVVCNDNEKDCNTETCNCDQKVCGCDGGACGVEGSCFVQF